MAFLAGKREEAGIAIGNGDGKGGVEEVDGEEKEKENDGVKETTSSRYDGGRKERVTPARLKRSVRGAGDAHAPQAKRLVRRQR